MVRVPGVYTAMFGYDMAGLLNEVMYYERDSGTKETSTERTVGAGNWFFLLVWVLYLMHFFISFLLFATGLFGFQNSFLFFFSRHTSTLLHHFSYVSGVLRRCTVTRSIGL